MADWLMNVKYAVTKSWSHGIQTGFFHTVTDLCILFTSSHRDADNLQWSVFSPVPTGMLTIFNDQSLQGYSPVRPLEHTSCVALQC